MTISNKRNCDFVGLVRFRSRKDAMENFTELLKNLACLNTLDFSCQQCSVEVLKVAHNLGNQLYLLQCLKNAKLPTLRNHLQPGTWPSTILQIPDLGQICGFATVCGRIEMHFLSDCGIVSSYNIFQSEKTYTRLLEAVIAIELWLDGRRLAG